MRQVGEHELRAALRYALKEISPSVLKAMAHSHDGTRQPAMDLAVDVIMHRLRRFEVMVDAPPYPGDSADYTPNGKREA